MESAAANTGSDAKVVSGAAAVAPGPAGGTQGEPSSAGAGSQPTRPARPGVEMLSELVAERDVPCPVCQYNLRGCRQMTCPECGSPLGLTVGTPRVIRRAWMPFVLLLLVGIQEGCWALYFGLTFWSLRWIANATSIVVWVAPSAGVVLGVLLVMPDAFRGARSKGADQRRMHRAVSRALVVGALVAAIHLLQFTFAAVLALR